MVKSDCRVVCCHLLSMVKESSHLLRKKYLPIDLQQEKIAFMTFLQSMGTAHESWILSNRFFFPYTWKELESPFVLKLCRFIFFFLDWLEEKILCAFPLRSFLPLIIFFFFLIEKAIIMPFLTNSYSVHGMMTTKSYWWNDSHSRKEIAYQTHHSRYHNCSQSTLDVLKQIQSKFQKRKCIPLIWNGREGIKHIKKTRKWRQKPKQFLEIISNLIVLTFSTQMQA